MPQILLISLTSWSCKTKRKCTFCSWIFSGNGKQAFLKFQFYSLGLTRLYLAFQFERLSYINYNTWGRAIGQSVIQISINHPKILFSSLKRVPHLYLKCPILSPPLLCWPKSSLSIIYKLEVLRIHCVYFCHASSRNPSTSTKYTLQSKYGKVKNQYILIRALSEIEGVGGHGMREDGGVSWKDGRGGGRSPCWVGNLRWAASQYRAHHFSKCANQIV